MFSHCDYCGVPLLPNGEDEDGACAQCTTLCPTTMVYVDNCQGCALGTH